MNRESGSLRKHIHRVIRKSLPTLKSYVVCICDHILPFGDSLFDPDLNFMEIIEIIFFSGVIECPLPRDGEVSVVNMTAWLWELVYQNATLFFAIG